MSWRYLVLPTAIYCGVYVFQKFTWTEAKKERKLKEQVRLSLKCVQILFQCIQTDLFFLGREIGSAHLSNTKQLQQCPTFRLAASIWCTNKCSLLNRRRLG